MDPSSVDVLGGFHYFVVRLLGIVPEPGGNRVGLARQLECERGFKKHNWHPDQHKCSTARCGHTYWADDDDHRLCKPLPTSKEQRTVIAVSAVLQTVVLSVAGTDKRVLV